MLGNLTLNADPTSALMAATKQYADKMLPLAGGTMTGALKPSTTAGLTGTTLGDNANAGAVGEVISSGVVQGSAVALSTGIRSTVTTISLTAGDWDVSGCINFYPAASTTGSYISGAINTAASYPTRGTSAADLDHQQRQRGWVHQRPSHRHHSPFAVRDHDGLLARNRRVRRLDHDGGRLHLRTKGALRWPRRRRQITNGCCLT